jgi:hypothetical protein
MVVIRNANLESQIFVMTEIALKKFWKIEKHVATFKFYGYGNDLKVVVFWKASVRLSITIRLTAWIDTDS